ncbi:MAG: nucleotidyltransferase domain-containing protein [Clostridiales bacterium]|nr:nucleotidyltransferase domain-containing protein [Clostridiales bacterium]
MIYTIEEIKRRVAPVAEKYNLKAVYLFGSYARGEADDDSDVDLLIDRTGSTVASLFDMGGLFNDMEQSVGKEIDIITTQTLEQKRTIRRFPGMVKSIADERVLLYE